MEQPTPEDKDWTWVLERPCAQCGYDTSTPARSDLGPMIRANAAAWRSLLARGDLATVRPPVPDGTPPVWSALEYGCHVRDVYRIFGERLKMMLSKSDPTFPNWDQDAAAVDENYRDQDAAKVGYALAVNAGRVADMVDRVGDKQWDRSGQRAGGGRFTVESLIRYLLHDVVHHVHDVEEGYRLLAPDEDDGADGDGGDGGDGSAASNGADAGS